MFLWSRFDDAFMNGIVDFVSAVIHVYNKATNVV